MSLDTGDGPTGTGPRFAARVENGADSLADAFYPVYRRLFSEGDSFVADVESRLAEARMTTTVEHYLSQSIGVGVVAGLALWVLGVATGAWLLAGVGYDVGTLVGVSIENASLLRLVEAAKAPAMVLGLGVVFGTVGFLAGFGGLVAVPYVRASSRKREINMLLPDAVSFMYALSAGGLDQLEILEAMAQADDTYGEVAREFQSVVQETEYFDTDYRTALRNRATETPSEEFGQFLTDMLSIVNSGGDLTSFFDQKKDEHMRTARVQQERTLETLELFAEMYITLSLFPLLLLVILVVMRMIGDAGSTLLYATVYGLVPVTGVGFLVLVATVKRDEFGDGVIRPETESEWFETDAGPGALDGGGYSIFDRIRRREWRHRAVEAAKRPHAFFKENPTDTLGLTVPAAAATVGVAVATGSTPTTWSGVVDQPVWGTFAYVYLPVYVALVPLAVFYEWNVRSRRAILHDLSDSLRKLAGVNETGVTLLESIETVSRTSSGRLADEFGRAYTKVNYGMRLEESLVEFNNEYRVPRLARTVKLVTKAHEASSQITTVLSTAARASENQDDIERERRSRTRMQVAIVLMTFVTLLGVMAILKTQFVEVMARMSAETAGDQGRTLAGNVNASRLSLLFFHAVTLQAVLSGLISGYVRNADLLSGTKYVVALLTLALATWTVVG